jgi:hypothetical protein
MPTYERIEKIPDFPAIQEIQSALWGEGASRGAAVLVGAGFSRNAVLAGPNSPRPPLWTDFSRVMATRLYPNGNSPADPLRLAEEYKAALGQAALERLISDLVRNDEWAPGELHSKLVSLPWADILTTNWDTLLERAAETTDQQTYETVRTEPYYPSTKEVLSGKIAATFGVDPRAPGQFNHQQSIPPA